MVSLAEFLSPEAGQRRRQWLDDKGQQAIGTLQYYLGPGVNVGNTISLADMLNPVGDITRAGTAARGATMPGLSPSQRAGYVGSAATDMASVLAPVVGAAYADDAARGLTEGLANLTMPADDAATRFIADEFGGVGRTKREDAFVRYLSSRTFKTEDEARQTLRYFLNRWNNEPDMFGQMPKEILPDDLIDRMIVRRGGAYGVSQAGRNPRPEFRSSPEPIGDAPRALWGGLDTQDYRKTARPGEVIEEAYVPLEALPKARLAGGRTGYDWSELEGAREIPPVTIRRNPNGSVSIIDGNHRIQWARDSGLDSLPAYIIKRPE